MQKVFLLVSAVLLLQLTACNEPQWIAKQAFADQVWGVGEALSFEASEEGALSIRLDLNADNYPYRNIYLKVQATDANGIQSEWVLGDTLMDEMGNWDTEQTSERLEFFVPMDFQLAEDASYPVQIQLMQYMRTEELEGVYQVGVFERNP